MKIKTQNWKAIGCLLGLVFVCLAPIIFLVANDLNYLFIAFFAFFSLAFSAIMLMSQKRISIYSIMALLIGLLFLASGVIEFGYIPFAQNMTIAQQTKFSSILRPDQISGALCLIGLGISLVLLGYRQITTTDSPNTNTQVYRNLNIIPISSGIYTFITGLYLVIIGLYPSTYQIRIFANIGRELAIISLGPLTAWYMVAQPFIEKKRSMASLNDKSA